MKPICVVICNFNKQDYVLGAIESVLKTADQLADVLVVDNASTDDSAALIRQLYPNIRLDVLKENIGGSGGFAHGMHQAQQMGYRYITLLDNDAVVLPNTLAGMMDLLANHSDIGVVGPAVCKMDNPEVVQEVGANVSLKDATFSFHLNFAGESYASIAMELVDCDYVPACCLMTKAEIIQQIGGFDEDFFLYWDDIDWCVRVKDAGWRVVAQPRLQALHKGGGANATNTLPRYYYWRNKLRFFAKHPVRYPPHQVQHYVQRSLARSITFQHLNAMDELLVAMQRGLQDAATGIGGRYQGGAFPDRGSGKKKLLHTMIPPGVYLLDTRAVANADMSAARKHNSLCRFIVSCGQFSVDSHSFMLDPALYEALSKSIREWPECVTTVPLSELPNVTHLVVVPHLFDITSTEVAHDELLTDLFWNLLPQTVDGATALKMATVLESSRQSVDAFFAVEA
ncbi:glycosyltransferase family 2 protein [Aeromonas veronii]|uniref:glycosyltransferase family 2 protein n=1 Tax=Aeromonas veronii TaxID=654 RepID=UPI0032ECB836